MQMLLPSAVTLGAAIALFVVLYRLVQHEHQVGDRVLLSRIRGGLDWLCEVCSQSMTWVSAWVGRVQLPLAERESAHPSVVTMLRHATHTPLTVTHTNNHLSQMRDHKLEVALTPAQKRKLSKKKLEERF